MAPKRGLGRGLSNLIPTDDTTEDVSPKASKQTKTGAVTKTEVVKKVEQTLNINRIEPNKNQPRKEFNEDALQELADSIKQFGVIEPLVVVKRKGYYELIAGERRWRAARLAGLKEVPVVIKDYDDQQIVEIALIENIQREDLNPIEEAHAYERLIQEFNLTQDEVAERVSKSRTTVTNALRLLKLTEKVQQMLIDDMLSTGHVRALITITDLISCKWIARCINRCVNPLCFCKLEEFNQKVHLQKRFTSTDGYSSVALPIRLITKCLLEQIFRSSRFNLDAFI